MFLFLFLLLAPPLLLAAEPVRRPEPRDGDFWQFQVSHKEWVNYDSRAIRSGNYELVYNRGRVRVFKLSDGAKVEIRGPQLVSFRVC